MNEKKKKMKNQRENEVGGCRHCCSVEGETEEGTSGFFICLSDD